MIFVVTGTESFPFDRLIKEIDLMKKNNVITSDVLIQLGSCQYIPTECKWEKWFSFDRMIENIKESDVIITHAGAGTTLLCLELGKQLILVTRQKKYGEHIDDHQIEFAELMNKHNYASVAYDVKELSSIYQQYKTGMKMNSINDIEKKSLILALNKWYNS